MKTVAVRGLLRGFVLSALILALPIGWHLGQEIAVRTGMASGYTLDMR